MMKDISMPCIGVCYLARPDPFVCAISAAAFYGVGEISGAHANAGKPNFFMSPEHIAQTVGHAVVGCAQATASGGSCASGATAAAFSALVGPKLPGKTGTAVNFAGRVIAGAIGAKVGGGTYEGGAFTAAFGYLFNDLYAHVWDPRISEGSVGHVMVLDKDGNVIESQFPANGKPIGQNITKSVDETIAAEGRKADSVFRIKTTPEQDALASKIGAQERSKLTWSLIYQGNETTNCSIAGSNVMSAVNAFYADSMRFNIPSPWLIGSSLQSLSRNEKSGVVRLN
jgi:hypothetical protein